MVQLIGVMSDTLKTGSDVDNIVRIHKTARKTRKLANYELHETVLLRSFYSFLPFNKILG